MPVLIGLLAAAYVSFVMYHLLPIPHAYWHAQAHTALSVAEPLPALPWWRAFLVPFNGLARFAPVTGLLKTRTQLYWAKRAGKWRGWSEIDVWGLRFAGLFAGALLSVTLGEPLPAVLLPAIGFLYPGLRLSGVAEQVIRQVKRELPEFVQTFSLLVALGKGDDEALRRLSEGRSILADWTRETLALAGGKSLFTPSARLGQREQEGFLVTRARETGLSELVDFAVQVDLIHQKGVGAEQMLDDLAASTGANYNAAVLARAETLGDRLVFPIMLFYFLPYLAALLLPLFRGLGAITR